MLNGIAMYQINAHKNTENDKKEERGEGGKDAPRNQGTHQNRRLI